MLYVQTSDDRVNGTEDGIYQYEKLPCNDALRILCLKPGDRTDPLNVTLETVPAAAVSDRLANTFALSYVWGNPARRKFIVCNDMAFSITANLKTALQAIRRPDVETLLWADAICINQVDPRERNHQIRLMTQIYSKAKSVLVWLGLDPRGVGERAFGIARRLASITRCDPSRWNWRKDEDIKALREMLSRDWFNRMWTMQEIGLASDATFLCGSSRIAWKDLFHAYDLFHKYMPPSILRVLNFQPSQAVFLHDWMSAETQHTFLDILGLSETRGTSDPKDRVFALLSHPSVQKKMDHQTPAVCLMEADYTKSVVDVYADVAESLIITTRRLDVLSYVHGPWMHGLPTWAPFWRQRSEQDHPNRLLDSHEAFAAAGSFRHWKEEIMTPSGPEDDHGLNSSRRQRLAVSAFVIGKVIWCSSPANGLADFELSSNFHVKNIWQHLQKMQHGKRRTRLQVRGLENLVAKYRDVLTCGLFYPQYEAHPQDHAQNFAEYWRQTWEPGNHEYISGPGQFARAAFYAWQGRKLFYTNTGHIGLGPILTKDGDEACILKGGRVPYVIRKAQAEESTVQDWNLVGECYVAGAMAGELLDEKRSPRWQPKVLV